MNILIAQLAHISPSTKVFDKYLKNAFKVQKKIDLVVLGEYVANKFFKEYRTKGTLKREFEANKKYFLGLAKKYKTTIVAPVIEWDEGKIYKSILVASNSVLGVQFRTCGNFRTSTDLSLVDSPKISTNTKATPQSLPLRFCESQNLVKNSCHSERSEESQKNNLVILSEAKYLKDKNRVSSVVSLPQNDKIKAENDNNFAESNSTPSTQKANSSIVDEFLRLCEASDEDRTDGSSRKRALRKCEKSPQDDEFALDSAESQNLYIYRATRLMDFPHWNERAFFNNTQKAQEPLIFSVGDFKVSVIFGWEAHFDELMTKLRKKGVDILCVPCANTFGSNARWQRLMQTRAFLNSCFVVRVNRTGEFVDESGAWEFYGESFIALPDGSLGDMMGGKEGILISEIEKENLENIKNLWRFR